MSQLSDAIANVATKVAAAAIRAQSTADTLNAEIATLQAQAVMPADTQALTDLGVAADAINPSSPTTISDIPPGTLAPVTGP